MLARTMGSTSPSFQPPLTLLSTQSFAMLQAERNQVDIEAGNRTGMSTASRPCPHQLCIPGVYFGSPRSASNQPSHAGSNFGNGSGPLFSIYSNIAEEEDNKMVERWQKDAQGILLFVSHHAVFCTDPMRQLGNCRLVFSPSSSEYWSPCRSRTSDHVHRIPRRFISRTSINFSPTQMYMTHSPLPRSSHHLSSLRQDTPSG